MDSLSLTSVYIILLLLPGFVSMLIARSLAYRPDNTQFDKLISAFVYTFLIHSCYALLFGTFTPWLIQLKDGIVEVSIESKGGLYAFFGIAISLGCLTGLFENRDWHMKFARKLKLTSRTSRQSLWTDVFLDKKGGKEDGSMLYVHLKDGRTLYGWPEYYADSFQNGPTLFLSNSKWQTEKGETIEIPDPGILLFGTEISAIQFYSKKEKNKNAIQAQ